MPTAFFVHEEVAKTGPRGGTTAFLFCNAAGTAPSIADDDLRALETLLERHTEGWRRAELAVIARETILWDRPAAGASSIAGPDSWRR